jgi:hypothetical protein
MKRIIVSSAISLAVVTAFAGSAWANQEPTLTSTDATFVIPKGHHDIWTLNLWSHGDLVGSATGIVGTLDVKVPKTSDCLFQVDVRRTTPTGQSQWYSGFKTIVPNCGVCPT